MTKRTERLSRRAALGWGATATVGLALGPATAAPAAPEAARSAGGGAATRIAASYRRHSRRAGGTWYAYGSLAGAGQPVFNQRADEVIQAYSVNKVAVATAVLDKVDRGLLTLDQRIEVTSAIVIPGGDGIFSLDGAYPSSVTLGHALVALLTVSDDTAVRLCGLVCPAAELNEILAAKGFLYTRVEPVANPNRFYLGTSTPRETHDLLTRLVAGELLSASSTEFLLNALRSPIAFTDGIRRVASSRERSQVATKAGWYDGARHEAGVIFDVSGAPVLTYALFGFLDTDADDFGATHPLVAARSVMGREFLDAVATVDVSSSVLARGGAAPVRWPAPEHRPTNGG
ncbi:serine hydrolase [Luedemannella flava]|uniref:Beta-lactamase n=1 Tax=Luedemannella flava TaxID=349316 RepID=A0ABP4XYF7_9ACTN